LGSFGYAAHGRIEALVARANTAAIPGESDGGGNIIRQTTGLRNGYRTMDHQKRDSLLPDEYLWWRLKQELK
jgi:hypothetical protein